MGVELAQELAATAVAHGLGNPAEVVVAGGQDVGLLVVQVLDAVLHTAQKVIGARHRIGGVLGHQAGVGHALQCVYRGAGAQFGELPAAHHLQQLHGKFNLADAAARHLDVVGALGVAGAALGRVFADLAVQDAQRIKHAVVQVAPEDEGQHGAAQGLGRAAADAGQRRHHPAFEPGKTFPFTPLGLEIVFQRAQRNRGGARVAVGPQGQVHAKHKAVLGDVANQAEHRPDLARKVLVVGNLATAVFAACGFAVLVVHIDQVNVAGHIELARAQLAHANHPHLGPGAAFGLRRAMRRIQLLARMLHGDIQRQFGQFRHGPGHDRQRNANPPGGRGGLSTITV